MYIQSFRQINSICTTLILQPNPMMVKKSLSIFRITVTMIMMMMIDVYYNDRGTKYDISTGKDTIGDDDSGTIAEFGSIVDDIATAKKKKGEGIPLN
mmetsp:Transcript_7473/g.7355  ORF Transcript_7473/g.7355 Transcript_7473/m.7355 type:complete len:97 (-) Transcript_7473:56-346(-)